MKKTRLFNCILAVLSLVLLTHCSSPATGTSTETLMKDSTMNKLKPCPNSPNCACSEFPNDKKHYVEPFALSSAPQESIAKLVAAITATGGTIVSQEADYIHATYTSKLMRFVDDVEFRIDAQANVAHVRSASRLGYSDFGVNKKRVAALREAFAK